ncbi:unnamed protein product [Amoebophrya sp. A25]|nr:unnamed protein product [Amoebophrya sp. A25]|eukprot:GSA25T00002804001.1
MGDELDQFWSNDVLDWKKDVYVLAKGGSRAENRTSAGASPAYLTEGGDHGQTSLHVEQHNVNPWVPWGFPEVAAGKLGELASTEEERITSIAYEGQKQKAGTIPEEENEFHTNEEQKEQGMAAASYDKASAKKISEDESEYLQTLRNKPTSPAADAIRNPGGTLGVNAQARARIHLVHYRLRDKISYTSDERAQHERKRQPFLFGRILFGNKVFCGSLEEDFLVGLSQRHWENCRFVQDTAGLPAYPPYPEASGYLMEAAVVRFLLQKDIEWRGSEWAVEDSTQGMIFAGTRLRRINFPFEVMRAQRLVRVNGV